MGRFSNARQGLYLLSHTQALCLGDRAPLHSFNWPETCYIDQAGLELNKDLSATVSKVLRLKICVLNSTNTVGGVALFLNQLKWGKIIWA